MSTNIDSAAKGSLMAGSKIQPTYDATEADGKTQRFPKVSEMMCRDPLWGLLFWVHAAALLGFTGYRLKTKFVDTGKFNKTPDFMKEIDSGYFKALWFSLITGFALALLWSVLMKHFATCILYASLGLLLVCMGVGTWAAISQGQTLLACCLGLTALIYLCYLLFVRDRISFTGKLVNTACGVVHKFKGTLVVTMSAIVPTVIWLMVFLVLLVMVKMEYKERKLAYKEAVAAGDDADKVNKAFFAATVCCIVFSFYWTLSVIVNVVHVTVAGVFARWYFTEDTELKGATTPALRQALTVNFGSICLGSFMLAVVRTLRFITEMAKKAAKEDGNECTSLLMSCVSWVVGWLEYLVEFCNGYAFVYCAVYARSFTVSASAAFRLMKDKGLDVVANHDLTGVLVCVGGLVGGGLNALVTWGAINTYTTHADKAHLNPDLVDTDMVPAYIALAFFMGMGLNIVASSPIMSGVQALFVCCAEEPDVLMRTHPEVYESIDTIRQKTSLLPRLGGTAKPVSLV